MDDLDPMISFPAPKNQRVPQNLWDRPRWNWWSFQHVQEIVLTTEVWRGTELPWQLPEAAINLDCLEFINHQNQSTTVLEKYDND